MKERTVGGPPAALRLGVLGTLTIWRDGHRAQIPAAKHRTVLATLLANPNRIVRVDTLVDELWPNDAPTTARKTIQGYVWRLRRALGRHADRLSTVGPAYQIELRSGELDVLEFESLVDDARAALRVGAAGAAAGQLGRALRLWRGPAFACVPCGPTVEAYAAHLDEAHLAARELLVSARLLLGQHAEVVPELVGLTTVHPHRESLYRHLMMALYGSGRRLDALEVFLQLRARLATDFGLEPGRDVAETHQAILRDSLDLTPVADAFRR